MRIEFDEDKCLVNRGKLEAFVRTQPFVDVLVQDWTIPINTWPEGTTQYMDDNEYD